MKTWHCTDCETDFQKERSTACLKCGSTAITPLPEIATQEHSEPQREDIHGEVREILKKLAFKLYDLPYGGWQSEEAIDKAMEKLNPYLREREHHETTSE